MDVCPPSRQFDHPLFNCLRINDPRASQPPFPNVFQTLAKPSPHQRPDLNLVFTPTSTVTHHNVPTSNQIILRLLPIELGAKRANLRIRQ
jgi:hypothetical protein